MDTTSTIPTAPEQSSDAVADRTTARDLVQALAMVELDELRRHHVSLAIAVTELSQSAGRPWPWGPDDPTVSLLRAAAKLAIDDPDASSEHADHLRRTFAG